MFTSIFKWTNLFTILTKFLISILPFYVIIKVYSDKMLDMWFIWFFVKEFIVVLLFLVLIYEYFFNKENKDVKLKFDLIDYSIFAFILYWVIITFINWLSIANIFFWWRYDFLWFVIFLIYKHWKVFLKETTSNLIKLFLLSSVISLFLWIVVKFILWEEILSLFWFSIYVADFWFGDWIPIYQWVEASGIRRFQWILDSPLAMWYFLLLFTWLFVHLNKKNLDFAVNFWLVILFSLIFITYSRAAMLWVVVGIFVLFLLSFKNIFLKYKKHIFSISVLLIILVSSLWYIFQDKIVNVFLRPWSTKGHFTRMETWIKRFISKPFWSWLATAGPAYRSVIKENTTLETDSYYIPESWFVQILVEGWIVYFSLFLLILWQILFTLYKNKNNYILAMFIWILMMNLFLHVFEYTYITILLFLFLGLFYKSSNLQKES